MSEHFTMDAGGRVFFENGTHVGDVLPDVDGYMKWWPNRTGGYLDEMFLRAMADYLAELNAKWDADVQRELGGCNPNPPECDPRA